MILLRAHRHAKTTRITLPREVTDLLDLRPGETLIFETLGKGIGKISHAKLWQPLAQHNKK